MSSREATCDNCGQSFYVEEWEGMFNPYSGKYDGVEYKGQCPYCKSKSFSVTEHGGCFITTACCQYHRLDDHCEMMETMRSFRDRYMTGERKSDLEEYYSIAPLIVNSISATKSEEDEYPIIFGELKNAVSEINQGHDDVAYRLYKDMIGRLITKYGI